MQTCRGSHTHTLVVDPKDKDNVYLYVSGYSAIRSPEELAGCSGGGVDDPNTALYTIVVIQVPLAHPELAKVVNSPRIFSDETTGAMNGLHVGNLHGEGAAPTDVSGCHDITAYPDLGLAAGACTRVGILLDIKDPVHPKRITAVSDPNFSFWHSAMFNNAGDKVIFDDEWGGGSQPRCRAQDPMTWGADSIFTLKNRELTLGSYYKMPAPQTENENCTAHNGSHHSHPRTRHRSEVLVSGRRLDHGLHRSRRTRSRSPTSTADRSTTRSSSMAASGRRTGTTATSMARRSPAASTSSS